MHVHIKCKRTRRILYNQPLSALYKPPPITSYSICCYHFSRRDIIWFLTETVEISISRIEHSGLLPLYACSRRSSRQIYSTIQTDGQVRWSVTISTRVVTSPNGPWYFCSFSICRYLLVILLDQMGASVCIWLQMSARENIILYYSNVAKVNMNTTLVYFGFSKHHIKVWAVETFVSDIKLGKTEEVATTHKATRGVQLVKYL